MQHYVIKLVSDLGFSLGILVSSTNKTDSHNIVRSGVKHHNAKYFTLHINYKLVKPKIFMNYSFDAFK